MKQITEIEQQFVLCIFNEGYEASLELRKIYQRLADDTQGYIRVIDESGEDYLYPENYFVAIELPLSVKELLLSASI